jgi:hypothetical protein
MPPSDRQNTPLTIPPTEELEALQDDLIEFCLHTLERAKKADDDMQSEKDVCVTGIAVGKSRWIPTLLQTNC